MNKLKDMITEIEFKTLSDKDKDKYYIYTPDYNNGKCIRDTDKPEYYTLQDYDYYYNCNAYDDEGNKTDTVIISEADYKQLKQTITPAEYDSLSETEKGAYYIGEYYILDTEPIQDSIPIKDIYYINKPKNLLNSDTLELYFTLSDDDKEDKFKPYISAFYRLQEILSNILIEHQKEYLYYKQITKITDKIKKLFDFSLEFVNDLETLEFIEYFTKNMGFSLSYNTYTYDKRQTKTEYKRYYDISLTSNYSNVKGSDLPSDILQDEIQELKKQDTAYCTFSDDDFKSIDDYYLSFSTYFTSKKEFTSFKTKLKAIYTECQKLHRLLVKENETRTQTEITPYIKSFITPVFKNLPYMTKKIKMETDSYILETNTPISEGASKLFRFITKDFNQTSKQSIIDLNEYARLKGLPDSNNYNFYQHIDKLISEIGGVYFMIQDKDKKGKIGNNSLGSNLLKHKRKSNMLTVLWEPDLLSYVEKSHLLATNTNKGVYSIPDNDITTNQIGFYLNDMFTFGRNIPIRKGQKYLKKPYQTKDKDGVYNVLSVKAIIEHTDLLEMFEKESQTDYYSIIQKFDTSLLKLIDNYKVIIDYYYCIDSKGNLLNKDITLYRPKEIFNTLYIKYYMIPDGDNNFLQKP